MDSEQQVRAVVERYVDGCRRADADTVQSAFRPDARMWGWLGPDLVAAPMEEFFAVVAGPKPPEAAGWEAGYASEIHSISVTGDIAVAVLEETGFLGADFTNHFSLVREDGEWLIATKSFTTKAGGTAA